MKIKPIGDKILLKVIEPDKKTKGGILLPENVGKENVSRGKILAVGSGAVTKSGRIVPFEVAIGDIVLFNGRYTGDEFIIDGETQKVLTVKEIIAIEE